MAQLTSSANASKSQKTQKMIECFQQLGCSATPKKNLWTQKKKRHNSSGIQRSRRSIADQMPEHRSIAMILADVATKSHSEFQNWEDFELGFWHPFGSHGRESPEDIINRKRSETDKNGWTLWSFQYRRPEARAISAEAIAPRGLHTLAGPIASLNPQRGKAIRCCNPCTSFAAVESAGRNGPKRQLH